MSKPKRRTDGDAVPVPVPGVYERKTDGEALRKVTLYLPESLETELKIYCAKTRSKMSTAASEAIAAYLKEQSK